MSRECWGGVSDRLPASRLQRPGQANPNDQRSLGSRGRRHGYSAISNRSSSVGAAPGSGQLARRAVGYVPDTLPAHADITGRRTLRIIDR